MTEAPAERAEAPGRLLKIKEVVQQTSLHRATIYRRVRSGDFPSPVRLGSQRVAWRERDIERWKRELPERSSS